MTDKTLGMICKEALDAYVAANWPDGRAEDAWEAAAQAVQDELQRRFNAALLVKVDRILDKRRRNR